MEATGAKTLLDMLEVELQSLPVASELTPQLDLMVFYRGLPSPAATGKHAGWSCEYACFIAYDASGNSSMINAWQALPIKVREAFWSGARVFPIVFTGSGKSV
jgi:hypothetical protein